MNCIFLRRGYGDIGGGGLSNSFADTDWSNIILACQNNTVPDTWRVKDQKPMTINGVDYYIDIIGKNHDTYTSGGKAPLTFQLHDCYGTTYGMNSSDTNSGGWRDCAMRNTHLPAILNLMPGNVKTAIKAVNKSTALTTGSTTQTTTSDKLFLLSEWEIFAQTNWSTVEEGVQYEYYASGGNTIKNVNGTASQWWARSVRGGGSSNQFTGANATGATTSIRASRTMGVSFAFCF